MGCEPKLWLAGFDSWLRLIPAYIHMVLSAITWAWSLDFRNQALYVNCISGTLDRLSSISLNLVVEFEVFTKEVLWEC